ncbi:SNF2-related protein, partial [Plantibacter flavus]|uniref:SNF2-related protein n=1 Tax=Plantibacter flavus TaxID=150123 RepID=UPI0023796AEA
ATRTKKLMELRKYSVMRGILTGTPVTNSPPDIFAQMEFLESGILGTTSYRAFVAEYSELLDESSAMYRKMIEKNPRIAKAQIIARDEDGRPKYKSLDKLRGKLEPHSFRVLKRDCLDLPEKIYSTHY